MAETGPSVLNNLLLSTDPLTGSSSEIEPSSDRSVVDHRKRPDAIRHPRTQTIGEVYRVDKVELIHGYFAYAPLYNEAGLTNV
jgi:hypothetical protein